MNNGTPKIGQLVRLDVTLRLSGLWLGPLWAIVCGLVASGGWNWNAAALLRATLIFFLVDGAWATLWAAAAETDWATPAKRWGEAPVATPRSWPYTQPDAPGGRMQRRLAHTLQWWREHLQPVAGSSVSTILLCVALGAALSAMLGWPALALSSAAAAVIQMGVIVGRGRGRPAPLLKALLDIGLAWLLAHMIFAPLTIPSVLLAFLFTVAYAAGLALVEGGRRATWWNGAQFAVAALLMALRIPVAAFAVLLTVIPQLLLEPVLRRGDRDEVGIWFARSTQAWLMLGMLIASASIV